MENRNGLIVGIDVKQPGGTGERDMAFAGPGPWPTSSAAPRRARPCRPDRIAPASVDAHEWFGAVDESRGGSQPTGSDMTWLPFGNGRERKGLRSPYWMPFTLQFSSNHGYASRSLSGIRCGSGR